MINRNIAWQVFMLNFKIYQPIVFYVRYNDVTQTESGTEVLLMQQNAIMNLYTLSYNKCSMILNGSAQVLLNLKKKTTNNP